MTDSSDSVITSCAAPGALDAFAAPADLTPAQALAYTTLLPFLLGQRSEALAVLEGYAGTGKTYLVARLLQALPALGACRVAVAAPTNKAVRVLKDSLAQVGVAMTMGEDDAPPRRRSAAPAPSGCVCRSIHSLLGLKLKELENGQQETVADRESTVRDYDVVVVDECSMLDDRLFEKLVRERGNAHVLLVGDPAQLPPVQAGRDGTALSPVFSRVRLKIRLTDIVRQAADNPIIRLSIRLRQLIEVNVKASSLALLEVLPPIIDGPKAALVKGSPQTLVDWYLSQCADDPESDIRIIAYTNDRVQHYNRLVHRALYGVPLTQFVPGERVIVHTQCPAEQRVDGTDLFQAARLITSDELIVLDARSQSHPFYPRLPAQQVALRGQTGAVYRVWVVDDEVEWRRQITDWFAQWRTLKQRAQQTADADERLMLAQQAADASSQGWAIKNAFAPLRHAYAMTCHKSQGSTFDCALVDFSDLALMEDAMAFNRALYVAVTRSREYLALVVT